MRPPSSFNSALSGGIGGSGNPIVIDAGRRIDGITFDTAAVGAYVIGNTALKVLTLSTTGAGGNATYNNSIQMTASVANSQTIAAQITWVQPSSTNGGYSFINNATNSAATLNFTGTNTNTATRPLSLVLGGSNTGNNTISGNLNWNNLVGALSTQALLIKSGLGRWILSGTNVFSGTNATTVTQGIQINAGILSAQNNSAL